MYAYSGRILRVDLSSGQMRDEALDPGDARKYLGGRGFGARVLFEDIHPSVDALDADNALVFVAGPLTGTFVPCTSRFHIMAKSPLTGIYGESNAGGGFGVQMKRAGYDMLVVQGRSESPVYLLVEDSNPQLRDAAGLWGRSTGDAEDLIREEVGAHDLWAAVIGPAGERLARIAGVVSGRHRVAGRTGLGAVMGSKMLKAVAVRGHQRVSMAQPEALRALTKKMGRALKRSAWAQALKEHGTSHVVEVHNFLGAMATKNFREGYFKGADQITGEALSKNLLKGRFSCPGCPVQCVRSVGVEGGPYGAIDASYGGPEYETMAALGSLCGNEDQMAIAKAHEICNKYGVDTISVGVIIAWAMECYERGILTTSDLDGVELRWGDPRAMLQLLEMICKREGIGELLSEGVYRAAQAIGKGSEEFAVHVKGLEAAMSDPRGMKGRSLTLGTGPRGAAHTESAQDLVFAIENALPELGITQPVSRLTFDRKAEFFKLAMDLRTFVSATGGCFVILEPFMGIVSLTDLVQMIATTTGWNDFDVGEAITVGERANNLARAFDIREGIGRDDDMLPKRFSRAFTKGPLKGERIDPAEYKRVLTDYYRVRGWTAEGIPTLEKLEELGLHDVATELGLQLISPRVVGA